MVAMNLWINLASCMDQFIVWFLIVLKIINLVNSQGNAMLICQQFSLNNVLACTTHKIGIFGVVSCENWKKTSNTTKTDIHPSSSKT